MRRLARLPLPGIVFSILFASSSLAQPNVVPAEHPVYDFLQLQDFEGSLEGYSHAMRPYSQGEVLNFLVQIEESSNDNPERENAWLTDFLREFGEDPSTIESVISGNTINLPWENDSEKYLYYHDQAPWRVALEAIGYAQFRTAKENESYSGLSVVPEFVIKGSYNSVIGFYSSTFNGIQIGGDTRVLTYDPFLRPLYYIQVEDPPVGHFDRTSASIRVEEKGLFAEIANERLIAGSHTFEPIILGSTPDYFPFVRVGLKTSKVLFQFIHASLGNRSFWIPDPSEPEYARLSGIERYMAMHRLEYRPSRKLTLSFSELIVYGLRGPEIAYLIPFAPFTTSEHALWDRDNVMFGLEAEVRPGNGLHAHVSFLADDLNFTLIGKNAAQMKWAFQAGVAGSLKSRYRLGLEYTRIEPFMYSHRFRDENGSYYNAFQHNGFGLGHSIGPNADQLRAGLSGWLPNRTRFDVRLDYTRRGENYVDTSGEPVNVGGDILNGYMTADQLENG